jgi:hypothetical protein
MGWFQEHQWFIIPEVEPVILFNPYTGQLNIQHQSRILLVQVFTVNGALVQSQQVRDFNAQIQIREKGIILLRIIDENQKGFSKRIVKF